MFHDLLKKQIEGFEGREHKAYPDPLTHGAPWTIGIGHTGQEVHPGLVWTDAQIDVAFEADCVLAEKQCANKFPWFGGLNEPRKAVLVGLVFQLGINRLVNFRLTLAAIAAQRWSQAASEMLNSDWHKQTPTRAEKLAKQIESGTWQ